jgi:hypothetical protein
MTSVTEASGRRPGATLGTVERYMTVWARRSQRSSVCSSKSRSCFPSCRSCCGHAAGTSTKPPDYFRFPSQIVQACVAACCARCSISSSVRVLRGCSIATGTSSTMPSASRCTSASCRNSVVTMTAVGRPAASSLMPSCVQHDVHDPQSPIAVRTMSLLAAIVSSSAGSASFEKLSLR